jgi:hypothetical protein
MPNFLNYGSTGRPPGKYLRHYRLRHSSKKITENLESLYPPFDIFFTTNNNDNDNNYYYNNGGIQTTINYNTSTYDDNKEADTAHSIHRTDKIKILKWFESISNNNNIDITNNNNNYSIICYYNNGGTIDDEEGDIKEGGPYGTSLIGTVVAIDLNDWSLNQMISNNNNTNNNNKNNNKLDTSFSYSTDATTTNSTINHNTSTYDDNKEADTAQRIHCTDKIKWFNTANNNKHHHHHQQQQQQQQHYHGKQRHQFHLEQQQKHQHLKQGHHNAERMAISIILKLTLVAWDMWTFRNGF